MRSGPKLEVTAPPLDLSHLPPAGVARVDAFAREYLRVPVGRGARGPFRLRPWQREIVAQLFSARSRPRQALIAMPRGNGKTTLAAVLALYGLFADGVEGAQVVVVASDARQAGITLRLATRMVELEPRLLEQVQLFQSRIFVPCTASTLTVLPAEPGALQGWNPSLAIVDELHVVTRQVWDAVALAGGKRKHSLVLAISTPGSAREGIMWDLVQRGRALQPGFVYVEYAAPEGCHVADEAAWAAANPALGDFLYVDALRATLHTTREAEFRRFRLGQWTEHEDAWLPRAAWEACADPRPIPDGEEVVLGFDGSYSGDATAIVAVEVGDVPHIDVVRLWEPPVPAPPGWQVPIVDVEDALREACRRWRVQAIVADPFRWARSLQLLALEGLPVEEYPQSAARMTPATQRFQEAVLNKALSHSGDPGLARHVGNAVVRADSRGSRIIKEHKHSTRRIDLAVAAVMAHDVAATVAPGPQIWIIGED